MERSPETRSGNGLDFKWFALAVISHTAWGGYPVFARYLQKVHHISTMSLSSVTNFLAVAGLLIFFAPRIRIKAVTLKEFLFFCFIILSRNLLNLYAARLTYANNIQLFSLLAPFIVAIISRAVYKEALPRHTVPALLACVLGAVLMIFGGDAGGGVSDAKNPLNWLGILLSIAGGVQLALLMLSIKHLGGKGANAETIAFLQFAALTLFTGIGSLSIKEDWTPWLSLRPSGIAVCLVYSFIVLLFGTILQNSAIKKIGAPSYTTIQTWRLISTIAFSWALMGEGIAIVWQGVGALIVAGAISFYMLSQKVNLPRI
jgi:drug/metabolite transporter (DMT)-like permease